MTGMKQNLIHMLNFVDQACRLLGCSNSREPLPTLVYSRTEVTTVLALSCDVLVAFEKG